MLVLLGLGAFFSGTSSNSQRRVHDQATLLGLPVPLTVCWVTLSQSLGLAGMSFSICEMTVPSHRRSELTGWARRGQGSRLSPREAPHGHNSRYCCW